MIDADHARLMAVYNRWMNERLYALCDGLSDEERKRDRGAFFGSIHATLDHVVYGDLSFLSRMTGDPPEVPPLGELLHPDWEVLRAIRKTLDVRLVSWADGLLPAWLEAPHTFTSSVDGRTRRVPTWVLVVHLFNHQIHHRGQVTTLLSQLGLDVGPTDLPFMPGVAELLDSE